MSRTEKVHSKYGDVEVEVVDCDSCGETIAKKDAYRFGVSKDIINGIEQLERKGYACEYCVDGPISFPEKVREWSLPRDKRKHEDYGIIFHLLFGVMFMPFILIAGFSDGDQFSEGYATATVVYAVYLGVILLLWWFV